MQGGDRVPHPILRTPFRLLHAAKITEILVNFGIDKEVKKV